MLPNLIIAGFPKCGTTSLFTWLADHPQVQGSTVKETNYFVDPGTHSFRSHANFRDHGLSGYEAFFPADSGAAIILEATPQYAYQQTALAEVPDLPTNPRLIFVVRNPADQIFSLYTYYRSNFTFFDAGISFSQFLDLVKKRDSAIGKNELLLNALENCDYQAHIQKWIRRVGNERVLVYIFEDMKADKRRFMQTLAADIGIEPEFYEHYHFRIENYSYKVRSYQLHQLNIRIRKVLPIPQRSRLWRGLRSVYRSLNTRPHDKAMPARDQAAFRALKDELTPRYEELVRHHSSTGILGVTTARARTRDLSFSR